MILFYNEPTTSRYLLSRVCTSTTARPRSRCCYTSQEQSLWTATSPGPPPQRLDSRSGPSSFQILDSRLQTRGLDPLDSRLQTLDSRSGPSGNKSQDSRRHQPWCLHGLMALKTQDTRHKYEPGHNTNKRNVTQALARKSIGEQNTKISIAL